MKLIILAFIISISLHLLFLNNYKGEKTLENDSTKVTEPTKKSEIKYVKIKKEEIKQEPKKEKVLEEKPKELPKEIVKELPKESPKESFIKKVEDVPQRKKVVNKEPEIKNVQKMKPKELPKEKIQEAKEFQKEIIKEQIVKKEDSFQDKTLENFLSQKEPINQEVLNELQRLYGKEYETFTKVQKAYLEKNLNNFQIITQRVLNRLGYPRLAAKMRLAGTNIVEFMFNPDGSISDLKITLSSGYEVFDSYTLELIQIAYKDYPKPQTPTKLKFNVRYTLY